MSGGSGDSNVSEQAVHTHSTHVQPEYHSTVALDWTRVEGVVHESKGVCMTDVTKWEPKYEPTWNNLPRWEHPRIKPNCSRRYETIYLGGNNGDTISFPYLLNNPEENEELCIGRRGRRLSGRVGEEVRRLEEGGEHVRDQVVGGGKRKHGRRIRSAYL